MPRVKSKTFETFGDGLLTVCEVENRTLIRTKEVLRFGLHTIGFSRFYKAKVLSETIDMMVVVPRRDTVRKNDICIINGEQYEIGLVQDKFDARPPCLLLTLKRMQILYKDGRKDGEENTGVGP